MRSFIAVGTAALTISCLVTPWVRRLAFRVNACVEPGGRHIHSSRIPRLGGLAVVIAFLLPLILLASTESAVAQILLSRPWLLTGLVCGSLMMVTLGIVDDIRGVRAATKLWVQCATGLFAFACGFRIESIHLPLLGSLDFGLFSVFVTVFWIVAITNALNLIDGLDGLAAGIAFFACVTNIIVSALNGSVLVTLLSVCLAGAILGFLLYNFNPASIFMGDTGSMFLGFVLALTSMYGASVKSSTTVAILVPILALGLPILDTTFALLRRFLERRPLFSPDRGHIHHQLLALGITHRRAVLILYAVSLSMAAGSILVATGRDWHVGAILASISLFLVLLYRGVSKRLYSDRQARERAAAALVQAAPPAAAALPRRPAPAMRSARGSVRQELSTGSIES